jgi:hypothetical protein
MKIGAMGLPLDGKASLSKFWASDSRVKGGDAMSSRHGG